MHRSMKWLAAAGAVAALGLGTGTATAATVTPAITIDPASVKVNGTGCPQGTAAALVSPDQTALTVAFSAYTATSGPSSKATDRRKACTTTIPVRIPDGFTWGVTTATYRGYAELHDQAKAYQGATYFLQGGSSSVLESQLHPDANGNWEVTDKAATVVWAPCKTQSNLIVTSSLKVAPHISKPTADSFVTMDTQDISMHSQNLPAMTLGLEFKRCS